MNKDYPVCQVLQGTDSRLERLIQRVDAWAKNILPPGFLFFIVLLLLARGWIKDSQIISVGSVSIRSGKD